MKPRTTFVMALAFLLAACSLFSSPTSTVKKFMAAAQKGDADAMTKLFSKKAVQRLGLERIRSNNQIFCETLKRGAAEHGEYRIENLQENSTPDGKWISLTYQPRDEEGALNLAFALSKEMGVWKIDDIGAGNGPGKGAGSSTDSSSPTPAPPNPIDEPPPLAPSPPASINEKSSQSGKRAPISGGVLNSKAISLPSPPYPPAARAAKATGTVVVQVTVDESGNVISAHAVSGHPLLQAAAVAAARGARFPPVKLSGEPVKVNGTITYNFAPQ